MSRQSPWAGPRLGPCDRRLGWKGAEIPASVGPARPQRLSCGWREPIATIDATGSVLADETTLDAGETCADRAAAGFSVGGNVYGRADTTGPPTHAHVSVRPPLHLEKKKTQACRSEPRNVLRSRRHGNVAVAA
jgi:hypothetical protein